MKIRERWESRQPLGRVAFFGALGPEEVPVYGMSLDSGCLFSMAVGRRNHLSRVMVPVSHLVYVIDKTPRQASGPSPDCRLYMANSKALDVSLSTMRRSSEMPGTWSCMVHEHGHRVRALVSEHGLTEIVPLRDDDEDVVLLSVSDIVDDELWPELRHKRREQ